MFCCQIDIPGVRSYESTRTQPVGKETHVPSGIRGTRYSLLAAALAILTAALSVGCSSDSQRSAAPDAGTSPNGASVLEIGALVNVSGPTTTGEASAPDVLRGWEKQINAAGGVAGHAVHIDIVDTRGDAPTATAAAHRLASNPAVVAVLLYDAGTEGVVADAITKAGIPAIGGIGYAPTAWGKLPNWLPLATSFPAVIDMGMVMAKNLGATKTVFPVCAENSSCAAAGPLAEKASTGLGMQYAGTLPLSVSAPDYTAECLKIKEKGVDYVMLGLTTSASLRLVADCKTQGYAGKWGLFDGSVWPKVMDANDPGVPIAIGLSAFPWFVDDAPVAAYRDLMKKAGVPASSWGSPHGTAAYVTMQLFKKALESSGSRLPASPTRADVVAAYGNVKGETLDGLLPQPITFTPGHAEPLVNCFWLATYEKGTFSGANLAKPICDPLQPA
jgi:branched-chain amino acid transport system substrate-binding protein